MKDLKMVIACTRRCSSYFSCILRQETIDRNELTEYLEGIDEDCGIL